MTTQEKPRLPEKKSCDPLLSVVGDRRSSRRRLARSVLQLINNNKTQRRPGDIPGQSRNRAGLGMLRLWVQPLRAVGGISERP